MTNCVVCNGPTYRLGSLGKTQWYRCQNCGFDHPEDSQDSKHYHVIGTLPGCMPNSNDTHTTYEEALAGIDFWREDVLDSISQQEADGQYPHIIDHENEDGKVEAFDYVQSEYTTYLYYITWCYEECLEEETV